MISLYSYMILHKTSEPWRKGCDVMGSRVSFDPLSFSRISVKVGGVGHCRETGNINLLIGLP